jgi:Tfp pilus assembly protein PilF
MNEKTQEYLTNAGIAFSNGKHDVALELCERAIAADPSDADAYSGAGNACLVLDKLTESETYLQKAVELDSVSGEKYFNLGNIKFGLKKFTEALANYAKAEQYGCADEVKQKIYYQMGIIGYMTGDTKAALLNFEKAGDMGAVNTDTKDILIKRLQIYIEAGDYANAENYAIQLKLLAPNEFRSYQIYFQILIAMGKHDKAEEQITEAENYADIESDIQNKVDVCFDKALICANKAEKEPEKLVEYYQETLDIFDDFLETPDLPQTAIVNIAFAKADMYLKLERFEEALACTEGISADDEKLREKISFIKLACYLGKEDYESAANFSEQLKQSENAYYMYFAVYSDAFIAKKLSDNDEKQKDIAEAKYNNAVAFFKNKAFENPQDVFALVFRVRLYTENGKYAQAEELIKLLPDIFQIELNKYMSDCKKEIEKR